MASIDYWQIDGFIKGFLSAYNWLQPDTYNIVRDVDSAELWLDNYCHDHPWDLLASGLVGLANEAYPNRRRTAPK